MSQTMHAPPERKLEAGVIHTISGRRIDLRKATAADYNVREVGWALSRLNRFGGAIPEDFAVASHAVMVTFEVIDMGGSYGEQFCAVHHDDTEGQGLVDMPKGAKMLFPEYEALEQSLWEHCVAPALRLSYYPTVPQIVKRAEAKLIELEWQWRWSPDEVDMDTFFPLFGPVAFVQYMAAHEYLEQCCRNLGLTAKPTDPHEHKLNLQRWIDGDLRSYLRKPARLKNLLRPGLIQPTAPTSPVGTLNGFSDTL
jgi:hypothetical protein